MKTTGPGQSTHLLLDVIALLAQEQVDYAVIGALAAAVHGVVRASLDADAIAPLTISRLSELQTACMQRGFTTDLRKGDSDDPIPALLQVSDVFGNRVDLLTGLRGMDVDVYSRTINVPFEGTALRVVGLEDFIAMKAFAAGPLYLADARRAIATSRETINVELLFRLAARFGKDTLQVCQQLLA